MRRFLSIIAMAAWIASCASKPSSSLATVQSTDGSIVLGAIADASLPKGECGMVLWTLEQDRPAPIFRYLSGKTAEVVVNGAPMELMRMETNGASAFGVSERQTFSSADGLEAMVNVRFSLGFDGGSYLERGLVTVTSKDGWRTVAPSAGLAGCRAR
jgi:hypothetical protein